MSKNIDIMKVIVRHCTIYYAAFFMKAYMDNNCHLEIIKEIVTTEIFTYLK